MDIHVLPLSCGGSGIRLQLRYSTLARAFESMERRHLDADAWNELLSSVGASQEEVGLTIIYYNLIYNIFDSYSY